MTGMTPLRFAVVIMMSVVMMATLAPPVDSQDVPSGWTCKSSQYADGKRCHCACGVYDPDCDIQDAPVKNCKKGFNRCSSLAICVPKKWTGKLEQYGSGGACHCGKGKYDPDCKDESAKLAGCPKGHKHCSKSGVCIPKAYQVTKEDCGIKTYADGKKCNCGCGAPDPDCDGDYSKIKGCDHMHHSAKCHPTAGCIPTFLKANTYSWDGTWNPKKSFPLPGMIDETHGFLPPGKWGWTDGPSDERLDIYNNEWVKKGLDIKPLTDDAGNLFGWKLVNLNPNEQISVNHRMDHFEGTPGMDIFDLKSDGFLQGTGSINHGDGPDMLRYGTGWSVDLRIGDELRGHKQDNDLLIMGTETVLGDNEYDIRGTTIHTGPGSDLIFVRNLNQAAVDAGNGQSGRTDALDPNDGDDWIIMEGNIRDSRFFGGMGDDVFVWYVDEAKVTPDQFLGIHVIGGCGYGEDVFAENGNDRLIMAVDKDTEIVYHRSEHDNNLGSFLSFVYTDYKEHVDGPTQQDEFARYYGTAPEGSEGQKTITFSYRSPDGEVFTHDFYGASIEEIQFGIGEDGKVYDVDQTNGVLSLNTNKVPYTEIPQRSDYIERIESFMK